MTQWDAKVVRAVFPALRYLHNGAEAVYNSHILDHVNTVEAQRVPREAVQLLQPGGVVRLTILDALDHAQNLIATEEDGTHASGEGYNDLLLAYLTMRPIAGEVLNCVTDGCIHRWQPMPGLVTEMLEGVASRDVQRCQRHGGALPDLELIETKPNSFLLEATK